MAAFSCEIVLLTNVAGPRVTGSSQRWPVTRTSGWSMSVTTSGQPEALMKTDLLVPEGAMGKLHSGGEAQCEGV